MNKTALKYLDYAALHRQFWSEGIGLLDLQLGKPALEQIVIRGEHADFYLAAIHREGKVLVFDLGQPIEEDKHGAM